MMTAALELGYFSDVICIYNPTETVRLKTL